jgi:spore coat polysaccharide biosynthesis protein SpsF
MNEVKKIGFMSSNKEITFLIQARLGSKRLPKKVLMKLYKKSLIENVVHRINHKNIVVLTSNSIQDDELEKFCNDQGISVHRGSENNVFDRFLEIVKDLETPYFARITGDNPFVEVSSYKAMLNQMKAQNLDRILNVDLPLGCSFEILTKESFLKQSKQTIDEFQKEHVTSAYYQNQDIYKCGVLRHEFKALSFLRLTIDEQLDLDLVRSICVYYSKDPYEISLNEIESLYQKKPELFQVNLQVKQKKI